MDKTFKTIVLIIMLLMSMGCGNQGDPGSVISTLPSTEGNSTQENTETTTEYPTTSATEITEESGIMPNTAGIVVLEPEEKESVEEKVPMGGRGVDGVSDNCKYLANEDAERLGVSKVLVCQLEHGIVNTDPDIFSKLNELLVTKYGCDFVVSFLESNGDIKYSSYDFLSDARTLGQQLDIITMFSPAYYSRMIREGFVVDITDYLNTTKDGQALYNAYPEEIWDMVRQKGRIYGYAPFKLPLYIQALCCNKELADELGLEIKEDFSFFDIEEILTNVDLSKEKIGNAIPMAMDSGYLLRMLGYYDLGRGIVSTKDAEGNWYAFNATENDELIKVWKLIREYKEKGWYSSTSYSSEYKKVKEGNFLFYAGLFSGAEYISDDKIVLIAGTKSKIYTEYDAIVGERYYSYYDPREAMILCVSTWSEYKGEALKFMTLINTETELANLLAYGIEDETYTYKNKRIVNLPSGDGHGMGDAYPFANPALLHPLLLEPENKAEYYKELSSEYENGPLIEYSITQEEGLNIIYAYEQAEILDQIAEQGCDKLWKGEYEDVEAAVAEINRMQKEAGIDEIIDALNNSFKKTE